MQIREGLLRVLGTYIERGSLTITEAVNIVQDMLFKTANKLYNLKLPLVPVGSNNFPDMSPSKASWTNNFAQLQRFLEQEPSVHYIRLQWLDYTSTLRLRILPIKQALRMFSEGRFLGIIEAVFGLLQSDTICPGFSPTDECNMYPQFAGTNTLDPLNPHVIFSSQTPDSDILNRSSLREPQGLRNCSVRVSEKERRGTADMPQDGASQPS